MARPNKIGLDYFPLDVDIFEDEKMSAISGEFGIKGEITVIKLLCAIYRNGYFILWNDLLKFKLLRNLPGISSELIESIVNRLVLWEFFDKALFDSVKVLTSKGIQRRYFEAVRRRKDSVDLPYLLKDDVCGCVNKGVHSTTDVKVNADNNVSGCGVNVYNNPSTIDGKPSIIVGENTESDINICNGRVNVYNNPASTDINVNKNPTKKRKGKEINNTSSNEEDINYSSSDEEESDSLAESPSTPTVEPEAEKIHLQEIVDMWNSTCTNLSKVTKITDKRKKKIPIRIKEMGGWEKAQPILREIFLKVQQSKFMNGDNKRGWTCDFDWIFENDSNWVKVYEGRYGNVHPYTIGNRSTVDVDSLSEKQKRFYNYLKKNAPFLLNMPLFPTEEEVGKLITFNSKELMEIVKEINNKAYLINGRTSIYETIMEIKSKRNGTT